MGRSSSDSECPSFRNPNPNPEDLENLEFSKRGFKKKDPWTAKKKKHQQVFLEGYVEGGEDEVQDQGLVKGVSRTKSLTDEDLDELKGCLDLGFGFSYEEIPELCNTLPALELCYSMSQRFLGEQTVASEPCSSSSSPIANWKISSPGDHPEEVKARLKFWAQAVACTVRLCS
ncbi:uncharacterized protein LOC143860590 [Tasmannia lanceolata]|uniref:uncharacterized protein LOC143860590 n=1 Tax=Tasmannia lanceolata TaxID=3420 RepID=UPI0040636291